MYHTEKVKSSHRLEKVVDRYHNPDLTRDRSRHFYLAYPIWPLYI